MQCYELELLATFIYEFSLALRDNLYVTIYFILGLPKVFKEIPKAFLENLTLKFAGRKVISTYKDAIQADFFEESVCGLRKVLTISGHLLQT